MTMRLCADAGCSILVRSGRCSYHERQHQQRRGPNGWARQQQTRSILAANPWCQDCRIVRSCVVDHITPLSHGGTNDASNLQALCTSCHNRKTNSERRRTDTPTPGWPRG